MKNQTKKKSNNKVNLNMVSPRGSQNSVKNSQFKKVVISPRATNQQSKSKKTTTKNSDRLTKQFCQELINWGIKSSSSYAISEDKLSINDFVQTIKQEDFSCLSKLKMKILDFVIQRRMIRDSDFEKFYAVMFERFPLKEQQIKAILVQILAALDQ